MGSASASSSASTGIQNSGGYIAEGGSTSSYVPWIVVGLVVIIGGAIAMAFIRRKH